MLSCVLYHGCVLLETAESGPTAGPMNVSLYASLSQKPDAVCQED